MSVVCGTTVTTGTIGTIGTMARSVSPYSDADHQNWAGLGRHTQVERRNKIAHEGDLQPPPLRQSVRQTSRLSENTSKNIVNAIDVLV